MPKKECQVKIHSLSRLFLRSRLLPLLVWVMDRAVSDQGWLRSGKAVREGSEERCPSPRLRNWVGPLCLWVRQRKRERGNRTWTVHLLPVCHVPRTSCSRFGCFLFTEHASWLLFLCHPHTVWCELPRGWAWIYPSYLFLLLQRRAQFIRSGQKDLVNESLIPTSTYILHCRNQT